jgi:hypothetical protein
MRSHADRHGPASCEARLAVADLLLELLRRTHLSAPSDIPAIVADQAASIGAVDVVMYLIDYEHLMLVPLPGVGSGVPVSVAGTVAGRAFTSTTILKTPLAAGGHRLWLPLLDGTERLGTLAMSFAVDEISEATMEACERYAHLVALVVASKSMYGDVFEVARRRKPMTIASELVWGLAPPLVFATDDLTVSGMLEPAYDNGGDTFDYAVNDGVLHLGVFDAMGHGLAAAGVAAFALAAYRHSRRGGSDLLETYAAMDRAVGEQFPDSRATRPRQRAAAVDPSGPSSAAAHPWRAPRPHAPDAITPAARNRFPPGDPDGRGRIARTGRSAAVLHRRVDGGGHTWRRPVDPGRRQRADRA